MQLAKKGDGSWYCPKKVGPNYCTWKQAPDGRQYQYPKPEAPKAPTVNELMNAGGGQPPMLSSTGAKDAEETQKWLTAMDFAASVYRGTGLITEALEAVSAARAILP